MPDQSHHMLYDSERFVVVAIEPGYGYEIVRKDTNQEVFLQGKVAREFWLQKLRWESATPTQEEVEATLDGYSQLALLPLVVH